MSNIGEHVEKLSNIATRNVKFGKQFVLRVKSQEFKSIPICDSIILLRFYPVEQKPRNHTLYKCTQISIVGLFVVAQTGNK